MTNISKDFIQASLLELIQNQAIIHDFSSFDKLATRSDIGNQYLIKWLERLCAIYDFPAGKASIDHYSTVF